MVVGSGASAYFLDSHLLICFEREVFVFVKLDPPMCIFAAERHLLKGTGKGTTQSLVPDVNGTEHYSWFACRNSSRPKEASQNRF